MTIQYQIAALCAEAEPLRGRHDGGGDELRRIVNEINRLRDVEAGGRGLVNFSDVLGVPEPVKRGRKPKVTDA